MWTYQMSLSLRSHTDGQTFTFSRPRTISHRFHLSFESFTINVTEKIEACGCFGIISDFLDELFSCSWNNFVRPATPGKAHYYSTSFPSVDNGSYQRVAF